MSVHEKQKHFKCWICEKEFGEKSKLKQQIIVVHEKLKAYKCLICEVEFGQKIGLKKHISVFFMKTKVIPTCRGKNCLSDHLKSKHPAIEKTCVWSVRLFKVET
jgi:DNA-directed RNA polymerase subunit RPC12/RpoP